MKRLTLLISVAVVLLVLLHWFYSRRTLNLLIVTLDTTRFDYLSCYNSNNARTPNLDQIAAKGVLFENAYSLIPITFPAHASIFLSRPPHELSLFNNGDILDRGSTLAEILAEKGYSTGAFLSLGSLKKVFGMGRGFQTYEETFRGRWYSVAEKVNEAALPWIEQNAAKQFFAWVHYSDPHFPYVTVDALPDTEVLINGTSVKKVVMARKEKSEIDFIAQPGENRIVFRSLPPNKTVKTYVDPFGLPKKLNLQVSYGEGWEEEQGKKENALNPRRFFIGQGTVVLTNSLSKPARIKFRFSGKLAPPLDVVLRNYSAEVEYMDHHFGILIKKLQDLKILDRTIIVITSDHGEALGERNRIGHLFPLIESLTRVPLIIYYPGLGRAARSKVLVNHLDILPTVLDLMRIDVKGQYRGQSLKPLISRSPFDSWFRGELDRSRIFAETYRPQGKHNSFAMIQEHLKFIQTQETEGPKWELYDLAKDPKERNNLFSNPSGLEQQRIEAMRAVLKEYSSEAESAQSRRKKPELDEEAKKMLRDLGYITP